VSRPCIPAPSAEHLAALATVLTEGLRLRPGDPPCILRIRHVDDADADVEIGMRRLLPGDHPLVGLVGLRADDDWAAIGVAATGRLRHLDGNGAPAPVRTTHLVGRDGSWAMRWHPLEGGEPTATAGPPDDPDTPIGRIDDACRRCLGLATRPAAVGTDVLWATMWLDAVLEQASSQAGRRRLGRWQEVAKLHPAVRALVADLSEPVAPATVAELATTLAELRYWDDLRRAVAAGSPSIRDLDEATAAWLDDGAFSRWALGAYPDLPELLRTIDAVLSPPVAAAIHATVAAAGSLPSDAPRLERGRRGLKP
jgi:hypothetical protein